jgi:GTP-binding protein LepA
MDAKNVRNFVIIAHVDHGKSTLADRFLEETGTVEKRLMKPQYLDQLELERERGITIKMAPVRMHYQLTTNNLRQEYILNLIDTPGHSDFSYEVSRALAAVEGAILLVDATQGIQAQTLANFENAKKAHLTIIGAVNKIDTASSDQVEAAVREVSELLGIPEEDIVKVSGKTGVGVSELLARVVEKVPPPRSGSTPESRALIFDSLYDEHKGIIAFVRVFDGVFMAGDDAGVVASSAKFKIKELGLFSPKLTPGRMLASGEIGYIATGIKNAEQLKIGDTIAKGGVAAPLPGYAEPTPVVFVSFYPESADEYENLKQALGHLQLNDASLRFEADMSEVLGRGFKGGFLGRLHFEITADRLSREYNVETVHSFPSVAYQARTKAGAWITVTNPKDFPPDALEVLEPMTRVEILLPPEYLGNVIQLKEIFRFSEFEVKTMGAKTSVVAELPLGDLISDLDDKLKSITKGYASLSYRITGWQRADVAKMEILVAENVVPGLTRIIPKKDLDREARTTVEKLKKLLPRQQFTQAIQAASAGRIIARETIPAMRKDVTGYLYGGDRTRKMKLWKKQQKGKKRLKERGTENRVKIPASIFKELLER